MVSRNKSRVEVFRKIYAQLNDDAPTYTNKSGTTSTYTVLSEFPEVSPTFPCLVVHPLIQREKFLGVDERPNKSTSAMINIDFFAKAQDKKNAIDVARDKVQTILSHNWITESTTVDTTLPGRNINIQGIE